MYRKAAAVLCLFALSGCQKMGQHGRVRPFGPSDFFSNGSSARIPVAGTVPRSRIVDNDALTKGSVHGALDREIPMPITLQLLHRGRERFQIYCAPCHSDLGDGDGMIVRRGFTRPPTYHQDRLRQSPAGHFFDVITHGYGAMFSYADRIGIEDRWAIVAYIRALQMSQHIHYSDLPPEMKAQLDQAPKGAGR